MKKVLIITYYWPPSGGVGVHRCLKFTKYLRRFGWEPIVYVPENAQYPYFDDTNFKDIPENLTVIKQAILEPFGAFKLISGRKKEASLTNPVHVRDKKVPLIDDLAIWIRGNFFIPDARSLWIKPSVKFLTKYLKENPVDAILTDGPPHTNTYIACKLSQKLNIPWLADFQDPWTQVDYYKLLKLTRWADRKHREMEQEVFKTANKITIASPSWKTDIEKIGAKNVDVIFWGYDEDDFKFPVKSLDLKFTIVHAGMLGYDRNPEIFFGALKHLKDELEGFSQNLEIRLAGPVDFSVKKSLENNGLAENTIYLGTVKRPIVLQTIASAHIQLLPLNIADNAKGRIPGKLFENIRVQRPILCLGPTDSDVSGIIAETETGESFRYEDFNGIKKFIEKRYQLFLQGKNSVNASAYTQYSVENQTKKIAEYLNEIVKY